MTTNGHVPLVVDGVVEARNDTGIKVQGAWLNKSRFRPLDLPEVGSRVHATLDPKGFLRDLDVLDLPSGSARDERIARLAVLKAAASFAAERTDIKSNDVLRIADVWLAWVREA